MTKAQKILELYAKGDAKDRTLTRRIAEQVRCSDAYVRVVARQRKGSGRSEIDLRYIYSTLGRAKILPRHRAYFRQRYATDAEFREMRRRYKREWCRRKAQQSQHP